VAEAQPAAQLSTAPHRTGRGTFIPRRLCAHWARGGWCRKGDACTFAHGPHELHPDAQMALMQVPQGQMLVNTSLYSNNYIPAAGEEQLKGEPGLEDEQATGEFHFNVNAPVFVANGAVSHFATSAVGGDDGNDLAAQESALSAGAAQFSTVMTPGLAPSDAAVGDEPSRRAEVEGSSGEEAGEPNEETPAKPPARRKAPSPLTTVEAGDTPAPIAAVVPQSPMRIVPQSPMQIQGGAIPNASPAAAAARRFLTRIGAPAFGTPVRQVIYSAGQLASPKAVSYTASQLASPKAVPSPSPRMLFSPSGAVGPRSPAHLAEPTTPGALQRSSLLASPMALGSPQPISRGTLLQARGVAQKIQQGPPGLSVYAPTPTSAARSFGFVYPQPGFIRAEEQSGQAVRS